MSTILERIAAFARTKNITIGALEKRIGASKGVLSRAIQNNTDIQAKWLEKIVENFPDCSGHWLLTGINPIEALADRLSEILDDIGDLEISSESFGLSCIELANFTNNLEFPPKPLDLVKFSEEFPEYNYSWILTGSGNKFIGDEEESLKAIRNRVYRRNHPEYFPDTKATAVKIDYEDAVSGKVVGIPLIPYAAFAGYGAESFQDLAIEDYYTVREFKEADFLIRIKGDSMSPKYNGGDIVACKKIEMVTFWQWHKIYAICTRNQGILVKRVEEYPNNPSFITCVSENPAYHPFVLHEDEIVSAALVLGAIVLE